MNLLLDPNAWSSSWGSHSTPPASWNGTSYVVEAPDGTEMSLLLHSLDELDSTAEIRGTGVTVNGESGAANLTLCDYDSYEVLDGPIEFMEGIPQDFQLNVPAGPARRVIVSFANSGYNGDYTITPLPSLQTLVANDDNATTPFQTAVIIDVLANDTIDGVAPVSIDDVVMEISQQPSSGTVTINPDGTHTYTPEPGFSGEVTYQYSIEFPEVCEGYFNLWCDWEVVHSFDGEVPGIDNLPPEFDSQAEFTVTGAGYSATYRRHDLDMNFPMISSTGTLPDPCNLSEADREVIITQGELSFCRLVRCNYG